MFKFDLGKDMMDYEWISEALSEELELFLLTLIRILNTASEEEGDYITVFSFNAFENKGRKWLIRRIRQDLFVNGNKSRVHFLSATQITKLSLLSMIKSKSCIKRNKIMSITKQKIQRLSRA